jgi:hypothetical protein
MSRSFGTLDFESAENKQLAQTQLSGTSAVSLYTPASGKKAILTHLFIAVYDQDSKISVYHDDDGTTYDDTTAIIREVKIKKAQNVVSLPLDFIPLANGGNIGVQTDKSNDVTFTLYGLEVDE